MILSPANQFYAVTPVLDEPLRFISLPGAEVTQLLEDGVHVLEHRGDILPFLSLRFYAEFTPVLLLLFNLIIFPSFFYCHILFLFHLNFLLNLNWVEFESQSIFSLC